MIDKYILKMYTLAAFLHGNTFSSFGNEIYGGSNTFPNMPTSHMYLGKKNLICTKWKPLLNQGKMFNSLF